MNVLLRSVSVILGGRLGRLLIMSLFTPILVRLLTQEEYGLYAYLMAIIAIITVVAPLGLFDAVRKHVAGHTEESSEEAWITIAALLLSGIYALAVTVGILLLNHTFNIIPGRFVGPLLAIVLGHNLFQACRGVFYGRQREQVPEVVETIRQVLYVVIGLGVVYYGFGVVGLITTYSLVFLLFAGWFLISTVRTIEGDIHLRKSVTESISPVGRYGLVQATGGIAAVLLYKTDIVLVEFFRGSAETALYQVALLPAEYVWFVPSAIQMALLQNTAHHWARDETDQINRNVRDGLLYASLALILFGGGLFVLAEEFVTVYFGAGYQASALSLRVLLFGTVFFGLNRILVPVLQATGWLRYTEGLTVAALLLNVILNVLLIPQFGIRGAAVGTASSYVFMFFGGITLWYRSEFPFLSVHKVARLVGLGVIFWTSFWLLVQTVTLEPIAALLVFPALGFVLFLGGALLFKLVSIEELRGTTNAVLHKIR